MSSNPQFAAYLAVAARDGRGGADASPPSINRGFARAFKVNLGAEPEVGDWTQGTFSAQLTASPEDGAAVLATYTASAVSVSGDLSTVTFSLAGGAHGSLPAADDDLLAEVWLKVIYTSPAGAQTVIIDTFQEVVG